MPRRTRKPPPEKPLGFVYFVGAVMVRRVKIGFSQFNPNARFNALNTSCPEDLKKLGLMRGDIALEQSLHARFAHHRAKLEWFHLCPEIEAFIAAETTPWEDVMRHEAERQERLAREARARQKAENIELRRIAKETDELWSAAYMAEDFSEPVPPKQPFVDPLVVLKKEGLPAYRKLMKSRRGNSQSRS